MPAGTLPDDFDVTKFEEGILTKVNASVTKTINDTVNGAVKGIKTDFAKDLQKMTEDLTKAFAAKPPENPDHTDEKKGGEPKTIAELNAKILALETNFNKTTKELDTERQLKVQLEAANKEKDRVSSFDRIISDLTFPTPKAKTQFRDAYLGKVVYDDAGNLIIKGENGDPIDMKGFIASEYEQSTHFQPARGNGGSGASSGRASGSASNFTFRDNMTPAEINALPADQKAAMRQQITDAVMAGSH